MIKRGHVFKDILALLLGRVGRLEPGTGLFNFMDLTKELVRELFNYKNGFLYWKIKTGKVNIGDRAGYLNKRKNVSRNMVYFKNKPYTASRIIFLWHHGYLPKEVDHKDRNSTNDKIKNLRDVSHFENCRNRSSRINSSSKYLGVHFFKNNNKWCARIQCNKKYRHLGYFNTEEEAALSYNKAALLEYGEYANLNIIK